MWAAVRENGDFFTFVNHVKTNKHMFEFFSPLGSHTILVYRSYTDTKHRAASLRQQSFLYLIIGKPVQSAAIPVLFLLSGPKNGFFRPIGATRCPHSDKCEIWHGEPTAGLLHHVKFHVYRGRNVGIQPPKLSTFRILAINLNLRGYSFALFLRNSQRSYGSVGSF